MSNKELFILLNRLVNQALDILYLNDLYLIQIGNEENQNHAGERSVMYRFAYYLQSLIERDPSFDVLKPYIIDCEYSRNLYDVKRLPSFENGIIPDIIIHKRGTNDENILVIEIKTWWNNDLTKDEIKLKELTSKSGEYKYRYGVLIVFNKKTAEQKWFKDNKIIN